jgi:hypothetical protein
MPDSRGDRNRAALSCLPLSRIGRRRRSRPEFGKTGIELQRALYYSRNEHLNNLSVKCPEIIRRHGRELIAVLHDPFPVATVR